MSDRALLDLLDLIDSKEPKWFQEADTGSLLQIKHKAKEFRIQLNKRLAKKELEHEMNVRLSLTNNFEEEAAIIQEYLGKGVYSDEQ
jgi:hypothetical protein